MTARGPAATAVTNDGPRPNDTSPRTGLLLAGLLAVAAGLRVFGLDRQLWHDEISALVGSIRRPLVEIATQWPGIASHPLFELLAHLSSSLLGETPFGLRLPAAIFGVAGIWAIYRLGMAAADRATGLLAAAFLTFSYHHVFYSQNARGYTVLLFFYLAAVLGALHVRRRPFGTREGAGYAAAGAATAYAHPFGLFLVPGHLLTAATQGLVALRRRRSLPRRTRSLVRWALASGAVAGVLYLPFLPSMLAKVQASAASPGEGPRLGLGLLVETLEGLEAAFGGLVPLALAVFVGTVGLWTWARRHPFALGLLLAPLIVEAAVFGALGVGLHPRYFLPALPVGYLLASTGLLRILRPAVDRLPEGRPGLRRAVSAGLLTAVVLASAVPLGRYYRYPKQDYLGALEQTRELASEQGGVPVGIHLAEHALNGFYDAGFAAAETYEDLRRLEARGDTLWLVTTLERLLRVHDPDLHRHIHDRYERVSYLPGTVGDGAVRIYRGPTDATEDPGGGAEGDSVSGASTAKNTRSARRTTAESSP